jgi:hypothetical protein
MNQKKNLSVRPQAGQSTPIGFPRRHFLQAAGVAGLGLGVAPYILAAELGRKFRRVPDKKVADF